MQNFGKIKEKYNTLLSEGLKRANDDNKKLFKTYLKSLKENKALKSQFLVYSNIENKYEPNEVRAIVYLNENLETLKSIDLKTLASLNNKLASAVELNELKYDKSELHENISKLIFTKKTASNIDEYTETFNKVIDYIMTNEPKVSIVENVELPVSMLVNIYTNKFNEEYADLSENEKSLFNLIVNSKDGIKDVYVSLIDECISKIDSKITEQVDDILLEKLTKVKDKLVSEKENINEAELEDKVAKLIELKYNLN